MSYRGFEKLQCTLTTSGNISEYMNVERHLLVISDRLDVLKQQKLSLNPKNYCNIYLFLLTKYYLENQNVT